MAVTVQIDCDGDGCRRRFNAANTNAERYEATAYMSTVEGVEAWVDLPRHQFAVGTEWMDLPDGWTAVEVEHSTRYPDGWRYLCEVCR